MRAGSDDAFEFDLVEDFDILLGHHLEDIFVPHAPGGFTAASLVETQYAEINVGFFEQASKGLHNFFVALIESRRAAHKEQHIDLITGSQFTDIQALQPS